MQVDNLYLQEPQAKLSELGRLRAELEEAKARAMAADLYSQERAAALKDCEILQERLDRLSEHAEEIAGSVEPMLQELADTRAEWQELQRTMPARIEALETRLHSVKETFSGLTGESWESWHTRLEAERAETFRRGYAPVR